MIHNWEQKEEKRKKVGNMELCGPCPLGPGVGGGGGAWVSTLAECPWPRTLLSLGISFCKMGLVERGGYLWGPFQPCLSRLPVNTLRAGSWWTGSRQAPRSVGPRHGISMSGCCLCRANLLSLILPHRGPEVGAWGGRHHPGLRGQSPGSLPASSSILLGRALLL